MQGVRSCAVSMATIMEIKFELLQRLKKCIELKGDYVEK